MNQAFDEGSFDDQLRRRLQQEILEHETDKHRVRNDIDLEVIEQKLKAAAKKEKLKIVEEMFPELVPEPAEVTIRQADDMLVEGKYEDAIASLKKAYETNSDKRLLEALQSTYQSYILRLLRYNRYEQIIDLSENIKPSYLTPWAYAAISEAYRAKIKLTGFRLSKMDLEAQVSWLTSTYQLAISAAEKAAATALENPWFHVELAICQSEYAIRWHLWNRQQESGWSNAPRAFWSQQRKQKPLVEMMELLQYADLNMRNAYSIGPRDPTVRAAIGHIIGMLREAGVLESENQDSLGALRSAGYFKLPPASLAQPEEGGHE